LNPATLIFVKSLSGHPAFSTLGIFHFKRNWFFAIFIFCTVLVVSSLVHYILFRVLRRKESISHPLGWGLQQHLGKPARAIFLLTCLLIILPFIPVLPDNIDALLRHALIMLVVVALGWFAIG